MVTCMLTLYHMPFHSPLLFILSYPSNWVLECPHVLPFTLVSLQVCIVCGSTFALSCNSHKAVEATHVLADLWPLSFLWSIFGQIGNSLLWVWISGQGDGLWEWVEGVWGMCREMVRAHP